MFTKNSLLNIFTIIACLATSNLVFAGDACQATSQSYTANDGLVLISTGHVITFQADCPKDVIPSYAVVDGHTLLIAQFEDGRTYQISWTNDYKAPSGQNFAVYDENGYQQWKKSQRSGSSDIKPLFTLPFNHKSGFTGPIVRSEFAALVIMLVISYMAINNRFKIMNKQI